MAMTCEVVVFNVDYRLAPGTKWVRILFSTPVYFSLGVLTMFLTFMRRSSMSPPMLMISVLILHVFVWLGRVVVGISVQGP